MNRTIKRLIEGTPTADGSVHLVSVLSRHTMHDTDPLLLLDAFDSTNPKDYEGGFPMHPHRGIETISYVVEGTMVHKDSLGNEDAVSDGGVQWMTAGSGILHEEMMPAVPHLYGVQLWLNLAKKDKMAPPDYVHIASESIPEVSLDQGKLRVLAGSYDGQQGFQSHYQPVQYYDLQLDPQGTFTLPVQSGDSITLFALRGAVQVENETLPHFHAAALTQGDQIHFANPSEESISVLVFMSERIDEPIAWRPGPIVMNTEEELDIAYREVEEGTFLKDNMPMHRS